VPDKFENEGNTVAKHVIFHFQASGNTFTIINHLIFLDEAQSI